MKALIFFCQFVFLISFTKAWHSDQLHVFDVVEEVKQNFYQLLDIPVDADNTQIKKAFRRLSLVLHPDKNDAPDAEVKFRQLVSVYDVLRDASKREHYNEVLKNGLPDWKSAVYYFRRVRKMGLTEMSFILFIIISIGQYLVSWASYAEKQFTLNEMKSKKQSKKPKKGKIQNDSNFDEYFEELVKPSFKNTLPFQIPMFIWFLVVQLPPILYCYGVEFLKQRKAAAESQSSDNESEQEVVEVSRGGTRKRRKGFVPPEASGSDSPVKTARTPQKQKTFDRTPPAPPVSGGLWTDDDLIELIRLVKKYPQGTPSRWERIAEAMNRSVSEVTFMSKKFEQDGYKIPSLIEEKIDGIEDEENKKVKRRADDSQDKLITTMKSWNATEQKALENALKKYPKGCVDNRWEKISNCVQGRSKDECILRYKQLFKALKEKKETSEKGQNDVQDTEISTSQEPSTIIES